MECFLVAAFTHAHSCSPSFCGMRGVSACFPLAVGSTAAMHFNGTSGNAKRYSLWLPRIEKILHSPDLLSANETGHLAKLTTPLHIKLPCLASPLQ